MPDKKIPDIKDETKDKLRAEILEGAKRDADFQSLGDERSRNVAEFMEIISRLRCTSPHHCACGGSGYVGFGKMPGGMIQILPCRHHALGETEYSRITKLLHAILAVDKEMNQRLTRIEHEMSRSWWDKFIHGRTKVAAQSTGKQFLHSDERQMRMMQKEGMSPKRD